MKQIFACLLLLFVCDVSASTSTDKPLRRDDSVASTTGSIVRQPVDDDDEESVKVVDVTGIDHTSKDTVIDLSGTVSIQCPAFREVSEVSGSRLDEWNNS